MKDEGISLRLKEWAQRAAKRQMPVSGRFVVGEQVSISIQAARAAQVSVSFEGGYDRAQRRQVCFYPDGEEPVFSIEWVEITWNGRFHQAQHSDLLGSLMALGIDRSYFGDLIVAPQKAWLACLPQVAARLQFEWTNAGRVPITVTCLDEAPQLELPQGIEMRDTVSSLRLDAIVQTGMRISRTKAAEVIRQGNVQLDHIPQERTDRQIKPGQIISIRHFGRICLKSVGQPTKKDRLPILLEVFTRGK